MRKLLFFSVFVLLLFGCDKTPNRKMGVPGYEGYDEYGAAYEESIPPLRDGDPPMRVENSRSKEKKLIKNGNIELEVQDIQVAKKEIDLLLEKYDGYYSNESYRDLDRRSDFDLTIRVPATNFEPLVEEMEQGSGKVIHKNINTEDVTDDYYDLKIRLANKQEYLERYRELLKKAKSMKDVLEIEEAIRNIVEEMESVEGRLKYLADQVGYSTLNLTLVYPKPYKYQRKATDSFGERLKTSLSKGWIGFVDFVLLIIRLWPFVLIVLVVLFVVIPARRRRKRTPFPYEKTKE